MTKYIVNMIDAYSGDVLETLEDEEVDVRKEFDTYEEADAYAIEWSSGFSAGADVLEDMGRDFTDPDDVDFVVEEVDD